MRFLKPYLAERKYSQLQKRSNQLADSSPLKNFFATALIDKNTLVTEAEFLVLDMETTGLNPQKDRVLSMGFTVIKNLRIQVKDCQHVYCRHADYIPDESVIVHQITEQKAATGEPIEAIFPQIIDALSGRVLVAHYADIEVGFLNQIATVLYGSPLEYRVVDTLLLAHKLIYKNSVHIERGALSLNQLRQRAHMPTFKAHNALTDAVATAELLLYQISEMDKTNHIPLKRILR